MERLLLVELAAVDRFHRGLLFPYLHGFATENGVPTRWLRFGVRATDNYERGEEGAGLASAALDRLREEARAFQATAVVLNKAPSETLLRTIRQVASGATVAILGDYYAGDLEEGAPRRLGEGLGEWATLLGLTLVGRREASRWSDVTPHFGYEAGNRAAETMQPLPFVLLGEECTYNRSLARNPHFAGLDLSDCVRRGGCSFCSRPSTRGKSRTDFFDSARRQLRALAETHPAPPGRLAIRFPGEPALRRVVDLARICAESELPPSDLLLDARAAALVKNQGELACAADALQDTGHRLHLALIGIESFSREELERMNKGVGPLENLDAALALLRLEEQYPETFAFREHGGLSLILFTPWTSLDDVAINLNLIRDTGLAPICGKLFTSRLRLEPTLPITALAQRDGLVIDEYRDPLLNTAARNLYGPELPWRFREPRVEPLCRIMVRLSTDTSLDHDELASRVLETHELAARTGWSDVDLAVALVEAARSAGNSAESLLESVEDTLTTRPTLLTKAPETWAKSVDAAVPRGSFNLDLLSALCRDGAKPVSKIEPVNRARIEDFEGKLDVPVLRTRRRAGEVEAYEIFIGRSESEVERAIELTALAESARDAAEELGPLTELGALLGYPECCVDAFVHRESHLARGSYTWLHLDRRMTQGGAISHYLNPWAGLLVDHYVPCSLDCQRSIDLSRRASRLARELMGESFVEGLEERMAHPWLVLLRAQGAALELIPETQVGNRFRFETGVVTMDDPELTQAAEADEIVMDRERLVLLRRGEVLRDLTARAFVWWHEQPLQSAFWSRVLALRSYRRDEEPEAAGAGRSTGRLTTTMEVLRRGLVQAMRALAERGATFGGLEGWSLTVDSPQRLTLTLGRGVESLVLFVEDARETERFLFRLGPLAFSFPSDHPLETAGQRAAVRDLARSLKSWLARL